MSLPRPLSIPHAVSAPPTLCSYSGFSFTAGPGNYPVAGGSGTSSIHIPLGYSVIMYDSPRFGGKAKLLTESVPCLRNLDDPDFENQVESYAISSGESHTCTYRCFETSK